MRSGSTELLVYALLLLFIVALAGMFLGDWRLVLYPTLAVVGVLIALAEPVRNRPLSFALPTGISVLLLLGYGALDLLSVSDPQVTGLVAGLAPTTALYFFGITPALLLVGVAFALTYTEPETEGRIGA